MINLAHRYAMEDLAMSPELARKEFDGFSIEFCDSLMKWLDANKIAYRLLALAEQDEGNLHCAFGSWRGHSVLEIDGKIHDLWFDPVLPTAQYIHQMFPAQKVQIADIAAELGGD